MSSEPIITIDIAMLIRDLIAMGGRIAALEAEVKKFTSTNRPSAKREYTHRTLAGTLSVMARKNKLARGEK